MPNANEPAARARLELVEIEKGNARRILSEFRKLESKLESDIAAAASGERSRLESILRVVRAEIRRMVFEFLQFTVSGQLQAVEIASSVLRATAADISKIDLEATLETVAAGQNRTFLAKLFSNLEPVVANGIQTALTSGIGRGMSAAQIAADIKKVFPVATVRALAISRTETNNAFRRASAKFYQSTPGVSGYIWISALDLRTCPICWALHGKFFNVRRPFATHVNCRCTMRPFFKSEIFDVKETGEFKFQRLTTAQQTAILGAGKFELYAGGIPLAAMIGMRKTAFGASRYVRSLREIQDIAKQGLKDKTPSNRAKTLQKSAKIGKKSAKREKVV